MDALIKAIKDEEISSIEKILSANPDIDLNIHGRHFHSSPIHVAFYTRNKEVVKSLLDHGANINIKEESAGYTALECFDPGFFDNPSFIEFLVHPFSSFDNGHSLDGPVEKNTGIIETIMENVNPNETNLANIFRRCLHPQLFKQINVDALKDLLEVGTVTDILNEALHDYLADDKCETDIINKYIETGVDLNIPVEHNGKEVTLCDAVYMTGALYGHFDLVEEMIAKGANLACILVSEEIEKIFGDYHEDRVQFVFAKLLAAGILKDKNTMMGTSSTPFVPFVKSYGKGDFLVNIGLLAKPPTGLTVNHSGVSCSVSWETVQRAADFPVTGYLIEYRRWNDGGWEKVGTIEGQESSKFKVHGLVNTEEVMFRVSARNYYGLSVPVEEPDFQRVLVLPGCPERPRHDVVGDDISITWAPPESSGYQALTEYRVEGGSGVDSQDWRILGTIATGRGKQWEARMDIFDFKQLNFNLYRVIAVNEDGESEPSYGWDLSMYYD